MKNPALVILSAAALWTMTVSPPALADSSREWQSVLPLLAKADPAAGEAFAKRACAMCHSFDKGDPDRRGPNLYGVVDSPVTYREGFNYSGAMRAIGDQKWTYDALDHFLYKPQSYVHGTQMYFPGVRETQKRADLIAYLRSLADKPAPLPEKDSAKSK